MKIRWNVLGKLLRPRQWPAMAWVILGMTLAASAATVVVGSELGAVAREPLTLDTR